MACGRALAPHAEALVRELGGSIAWTSWPSRMGVVGLPSLGDALAEQDLVQYVQQAETST